MTAHHDTPPLCTQLLMEARALSCLKARDMPSPSRRKSGPCLAHPGPTLTVCVEFVTRWLNSDNVWSKVVELGTIPPKMNRIRSNLEFGRIRPNLAKFAPHPACVTCGRRRSKSPHLESKLAPIWPSGPNSGDFDRSWHELGQNSACIPRTCAAGVPERRLTNMACLDAHGSSNLRG